VENASDCADFLQDLPPGIDAGALNAALPAMYDDLRAMASAYLRNERPDHTLQPTALVHESYLRLVAQQTVDWNNRLQFLSIAARMMRRILSNYARARNRLKRGNGEARLELDCAVEIYDTRSVDIAADDAALRDLEAADPRQARVVELRFFAGLTSDEISQVLDISPKTVQREWSVAKRWLRRELSSCQ
jgi:RNA polymerase sigma factor (TIGR02999 family)